MVPRAVQAQPRLNMWTTYQAGAILVAVSHFANRYSIGGYRNGITTNEEKNYHFWLCDLWFTRDYSVQTHGEFLNINFRKIISKFCVLSCLIMSAKSSKILYWSDIQLGLCRKSLGPKFELHFGHRARTQIVRSQWRTLWEALIYDFFLIWWVLFRQSGFWIFYVDNFAMICGRGVRKWQPLGKVQNCGLNATVTLDWGLPIASRKMKGDKVKDCVIVGNANGR